MNDEIAIKKFYVHFIQNWKMYYVYLENLWIVHERCCFSFGTECRLIQAEEKNVFQFPWMFDFFQFHSLKYYIKNINLMKYGWQLIIFYF